MAVRSTVAAVSEPIVLQDLHKICRCCSPRRTSLPGGIEEQRSVPGYSWNLMTAPQARIDSAHAMAAIPRIAASESSFAAGPRGRFSPRSHLLTTPDVTFRCAANTA
jgi:hypothetical protein